MKKMMCVVAGAVMMVLAAGSAWATPLLNFSIREPSSGSINYAGGATALTGSNIQVDRLVGIDTPLNNSTTFDLLEASLNFHTGNFTGFATTPIPQWNFGGGGLIQLVGLVDVDGSGGFTPGVDFSGTLLEGYFGGATVLTSDNNLQVASSFFFDTKDPNLLHLFGLPTELNGAPYPFLGSFSINFEANATPPDLFNSFQVLNGDVYNVPVPEPGSIVLLSAGLLVLAIFRKRHQQKSVA